MSGTKPRQHALLIGIDYYNDPDKPITTRRYDTKKKEMTHDNLAGCVNDILAVEEYLTSQLEFDKQNIRKLLAPHPGAKYDALDAAEPTYANIVQSLQNLGTPAFTSPGDLVVIYYSGHGARAKTIFPTVKQATKRGGDVEDEVLVPADIFRGGSYIRDLEFGFLLQKLVDYGLVLTVVLDCCHSGGAVRGDEGLVRGTPRIYESNLEIDTPKLFHEIQNHAIASTGWLEELRGCVVLTACQPSQLAREIMVDGRPHGVLTSYLMKSLDHKTDRLTTQSLYDRILKGMESCHGQVPHLIGDSSRLFFRKEMIRPGITVTQVDIDRRNLKRSSLRILGTASTGVMPNSVYAIVAPGFDIDCPVQESDILARVKISKGRSTELESEARFIEIRDKCWDRIVDGCTAVLQKLPANKKFIVRVSQGVKKDVVDFEDQWLANSGNDLWLQLASECSTDVGVAKFAIQSNADLKTFEIQDLEGEFSRAFYEGLDALPLNGEKSIPKLVKRLEHIARFKYMRRMRSAPSPLDSQISMELATILEDEPTEHKDIDEREGAYDVIDGKRFRVVVKNNSSVSAGFVLMNFCSEFGIQQVWPRSEPFKEILARAEEGFNLKMCIPRHLTKTAKERGSVVESLKLFAVRPATSLHVLSFPTLKDMDKSSSGHRGEDEDEGLSPSEWYGLFGESEIPFRGAILCEEIDHWQAINVPLRIIPSPRQDDDDESD